MSVELLAHNMANQGDGFTLKRILLVSLLLFIPLGVWLSTIGNPISYLHYDLPPGQLLYVISRLLGLYAVMLLWLQCMYGLLGRASWPANIMPTWTVASHRLLGLVVFTMACAHVVTFFSAASIRKNEFVSHLLLPDFTHGFYNTVVSLGWLAIVLMVIVVLAGLLRHLLGKNWIRVHRLTLAVTILVLLHSILIGSETRTMMWVIFYLVAGLTLFIALVKRLRMHILHT